jgi:hypothetical protein
MFQKGDKIVFKDDGRVFTFVRYNMCNDHRLVVLESSYQMRSACFEFAGPNKLPEDWL